MMAYDIMAKPKITPLHQLEVGTLADAFALLCDKQRQTTRDGKPFFQCKFRDRQRTVTTPIWADSPHFAACETWTVGDYFKLRATYFDHEKYGPQIEIAQVRPVNDKDADDGFQPSDFLECSRFEPKAMFTELCQLATDAIADEPLRQLTLALLEEHKDKLLTLPAHPRTFFPFLGGWLEHTLGVTRNCLMLADRYTAYYTELTPPLNRDLVIASAILHDIGRVAELQENVPGVPIESTVTGHLFGHILLGRDMIRDAGRTIAELDGELLMLLEHVVVAHLETPKWGSPRLPAIPEVLILHHADDLDAKLEMYVRALRNDVADGPFTERDPVLGKRLLKQRDV